MCVTYGRTNEVILEILAVTTRESTPFCCPADSLIQGEP